MPKTPSIYLLFVALAGMLALTGCGHIQIAVESPVPTLALACQLQNLLNCSTIVPIFVEGQSEMTASLSPGSALDVAFNNPQSGSGIAFVFEPDLNVRGFSRVEIHGASNRESAFILEYKIRTQNGLEIAATSIRQVFPASTEPVTVTVPITYDGAISEMAINFIQRGAAAQLKIETIQLVK